MSQKFHINKHGVPSPCRATKGNCPLGGEGEHFDSREGAQAYVDTKSEMKYGFLPQMESASGENVSPPQMESNVSDDLPKLRSTLENKSGQNKSPYDKMKETGNSSSQMTEMQYEKLKKNYGDLMEEGPPRERFMLFFTRKSKMSDKDYARKELKKKVAGHRNSKRLNRMINNLSSDVRNPNLEYGTGYEVKGTEEAQKVLYDNGLSVNKGTDESGKTIYNYNDGSSSNKEMSSEDVINIAQSMVDDLKKSESPGAKITLSIYQNNSGRDEDIRKRPNFKREIELSDDFIKDDFSVFRNMSKNMNENYDKLEGHNNPGRIIGEVDKLENEASRGGTYGGGNYSHKTERAARELWRKNKYDPVRYRESYKPERIRNDFYATDMKQAHLILKNKGLTLNHNIDGNSVTWSIDDSFRGKSSISPNAKVSEESILGLANDIIDGARKQDDKENLMFYQHLIDSKH